MVGVVEKAQAAGGDNAIVAYARLQIGKPYVYDASGPNSFDCSGLTMEAWKHGANLTIPHYSVAQYSIGTKIPWADAQPGDLFFLSAGGVIHHVMLCSKSPAGGTASIIEAPHTGTNVRERTVSATENQMMPHAVAVPAAARAKLGGAQSVPTGSGDPTGTTTPTDGAVDAVAGLGGLAGLGSGFATVAGAVVSGSFWRRVGLGVLGAALIALAAWLVMGKPIPVPI